MKRNESVTYSVVAGKRPARPPNSQKMGFSNDLWKLLGGCWKEKSAKRPTAKAVREFLQKATPTWTFWLPAQASPQNGDGARSETGASDLSRNGILLGYLEANTEVVSEIMIQNACRLTQV
jgi:hypothetical protein